MPTPKSNTFLTKAEQEAARKALRRSVSAVVSIRVPLALHSDSKQLVEEFADAMARKLYNAQTKYGYSNGWLTEDWQRDCMECVWTHLEKGDPLDVANYLAFMWKRGWPTAMPPRDEIAALAYEAEIERLRQGWIEADRIALEERIKSAEPTR